MRIQKRTAIMICSLFICIVLVACGQKEADTSQANTGTETAQAAAASETVEASANGQVIMADQFKITIPDDWTGNTDTQVWYPNTEDPNKPIPPHCLHCGARPLLGKSFEDALKQHIGTVPANKKSVKIGNLEGIECIWEMGRYKSNSVFLLEKNPGVSIMYFFTCQSPTSDYDQYADTFQGILSSIKMK